jgi:deazaflavin-dependent oxidoreductase (nitroreductase family)
MQMNSDSNTTPSITKEVMMSERPKRPLRRRLQARLMSVLNIPMRVLLRLPFPTPLSGRLMLLSYTGRKSGKAYQQPVSYVEQGDTLLTPGGGNWKWNLQNGQPVRIKLRGRDVLARPELIQDPDEIERLLAVMTAANPRVSAFVGIPKGADGRLDRARLETAVSYGFRIIRWHLGEEAAS